MAGNKRKFYVVWVGRVPGIYDNWDDCQEQVAMFPGAKYKSFDSQTAATIAFRGDGEEEESLIRAIADHRRATPGDYALIPEINLSAIAVDGACSRNPGPMEYRGVEVATGKEIFHFGPVPDGTNNVAEYLALVHALAFLFKKGDGTTPVYSDSRTARAWVRNRRNRTTLQRTPNNGKIIELLARADAWLQTHNFTNPILCWDTARWGEIPADFDRK